MLKPNDSTRLSGCYTVDNTTGCWEWSKALGTAGYGVLSVNNKSVSAHRFSYVVHKGDIPTGINILHKCDNPKCINPEHLFLGTQKDNAADREAKGRGNQVKGEDHYAAKLSEQAVKMIKYYLSYEEEYGYTVNEVASMFKVSTTTIRDIKNGRTWRHLC